MKDTILYRRFVLVASFIAAMGALTAVLIQETRPDRQVFAPTIEELDRCGLGRLCHLDTASISSFTG